MSVLGANCGPDPSTKNGHKPTQGTDQLWEVREGTIAAMQPGNPFCLGVPPNKSGGWDPSTSQSGQLTNCSSPWAQFRVGNATTTAAATAATAATANAVVGHQSTPPTVCTVDNVNAACYTTKGGGPCSGNSCPGPKALSIAVEIPSGLQPTLELCARLCYNLNQSMAGVEYGGQCSCGNVVDTSDGNSKTRAGAGNGGGCDHSCGGDSKETCGGSYHMTIVGVHCTGLRTPPVHPPQPPPQPIQPPQTCSSYTSKSGCPALQCAWDGGACVSPPPPLAGVIIHKASGLCLTVGRCAAPPPPAPPDSTLKGTTPCDIYQSAGHPCVGAHSMVRALYSSYFGPLYNVIRASDNTTATIKVLAAGGYANSAAQDTFCAGTDCLVSQIFDQSPNGNHLPIFNYTTPARKRLNKGVNATRDKHMVGGHPVYSESRFWRHCETQITRTHYMIASLFSQWRQNLDLRCVFHPAPFGAG